MAVRVRLSRLLKSRRLLKWVWLPALFLLAVSLLADNVRLYLKDGTYQLVREYQVLPDRIKYFSAEREQWEEIPLDLIDLDRTKREVAGHQAELDKENKEDAEEAAAIHAEKAEIASVPEEPGAYYIHGDKLDTVPQAEITVNSDKKRSVLKLLSPIPIVSGKSIVELEGTASKFRVTEDRPEFYFRLHGINGFLLIRLSPKKTTRMVETVLIEPVTNERTEQRDKVPTFTKQSGEDLYKIWPENPLDPGEYALIEYSAEQGYLQVWDFGVGAPAESGKAKKK